MSTAKQQVDYIRRQLQNAAGDNLERAESAFAHCTAYEMQQQYGQSGKTRQEIIDEYREHRKLHKEAMEYFERLMGFGE